MTVCNNMTKEIQRKITSLALMTIMLAGGMTVGAQGFVPEAFADHNANLFVSAENVGYVSGAQVVEILVIDDDLDHDNALPDITVNGDAVVMTATTDGNWYSYIADIDEVTSINKQGLNFGDISDCNATNADSEGVYCGADQNVVASAKSVTNSNNTQWPFIQTYEFPNNVEIQYNKAGGTQSASFEFDSNASGLSLDRSEYPVSATVHVTINDHRLNIDPTSDDVWSWNLTDDNGAMYRNLSLDTNNNFDNTLNKNVDASQVCSDCALSIDGENILVIADTDDITLPADDGTVWFTVEEDGGPNTGVFTATDGSGNSILKVEPDVARNSQAIITYDGEQTGLRIAYSTATISIQPPDGIWTSGLAIPISVIDEDANKNSQDSDDIVLTDPNSIIPTLVTGDPFTLGETSSDLVTWLGWNIDSSNTQVAISLLNRDTITNQSSTYGNDGNNPFMLKGFNPIAESDPLRYEDDDTVDNVAVAENSATVEEFSERAILSFVKLTNVENDSETQDVDETNTDLADLISVTDDSYSNVDFLVIDIENGYEELLKSLINVNGTVPATGYNFINYNVKSLDADVTSIDILVDGTLATTIDNLSGQSGYLQVLDDVSVLPETGELLQLKLNFVESGLTVEEGKDYPIVIDFLSFGFENDGEASDERIANQIIRLLLEESAEDSATLEGTLEYIMINQLNINNADTYAGLSTIDDDVSFIVIEDLTGRNAPSVTYLDVDATGTPKHVSAQEDAPSHSAVVSLDVESFKTGDTVTVTVEDLDLNTNSDLVDIYTVVSKINDANQDAVGEQYGDSEYDGVELGRLLEITFDDQRWMTHYDKFDFPNECTEQLIGHTGLGDTGFKLVETDNASGTFVGTFAIPAEFCSENSSTPESITGLDLEVSYVDFRDESGETTEVGDSAGVKATTGAVSLDRTVYPVPFGVPDDFTDNGSTTPSQSNTKTRALFPIHQSGMNDINGLQDGEFLPQGDLIVYVTITDPDFDISASGKDSIAVETAPVTLSVIRGSSSVEVAKIGDAANPIPEIAPDAGIFEASVTIEYNMGPDSPLCPSTGVDFDDDGSDNSCILQGDILQVEYNDPTDSSGQSNTVTDSATFDLRNGVLQTDKSVYIIGSDMILTLIEPDFDLDSSQNETYDLDLIKWSSSAATVTMGDADGEERAFDPEPRSFRETGPSTGIFQIVVEIPEELDGSLLQRGEEIDLEYTDWGPSGSDYVGDQDEDIRLTVFTSNFGATIDLDQKVYSWTDKVYITVVAPDHNFDNNLIDEIGETESDPLRVATKGFDLDNYRLVETGFDTGIFTGEVILIGFDHDGIDFKSSHSTGGAGPTDGYLETPSEGGISVSYEFSEDETVFTSSIIRWNIGDVQWLEPSYPAVGTGVLRVLDPDMNLNPEAVDNFDVNVASSTDASGITLTVTETNEATGIFEGTVSFTTTGGSSGHRLRVSEGDTVTADYADGTLPSPYTSNDSISITSTTIIGTIIPPLERAPASNLRIVNTFGNEIDTVAVDQQVQITADLSNGQNRDQDFAYLVQIQDGDGITVSLAWISGSLSSGQSFSPSASWTPTEVGTFSVTTFVWESIDKPTALSPPLSIDVIVN